MLARDERRNAVTEEVLQPRLPQLSDQRCLNAETMPEAASARRSGAMRVAGIEADRILGLAGVEVAHVVDARARDGVEDVGREVAVGIDDGDSLARVDVAHCEIEQERRFARAGFADDVDVALALLAREHNAAACGGRRNGNQARAP